MQINNQPDKIDQHLSTQVSTENKKNNFYQDVQSQFIPSVFLARGDFGQLFNMRC